MKFPRITRRITMLLAASALLLGIPAAATASAASATSGTGWIRLAHLSPNTPPVDVYLYSFGNSNAQIVLHHVAYGTVSPYEAVTAGDYSVAMRASGASPSSQPVLSTSVTVKADHAYTVAGMGPESGLRLQVLDDQLTTPPGKSLGAGDPGLAEAADGQVHTAAGRHRAQGVVRLRESLRDHPAGYLDHGGDRSGGTATGELPAALAPAPSTRWWSSTGPTALRSSTWWTRPGPASRPRAASRPDSAAPRGMVRDRQCRGWRSSEPARCSP